MKEVESVKRTDGTLEMALALPALRFCLAIKKKKSVCQRDAIMGIAGVTSQWFKIWGSRRINEFLCHTFVFVNVKNNAGLSRFN